MGNGCMRQGAVEVTSPTLPTFKVVVVGDSGSGKTSIVRRFVENGFDLEYKQTTDVDITSIVKKVNVPEHAIVSLELWDVPGQNDVDLRKTYYLDVDAVVVVTDISNHASMKLAGSWSLDVANHSRVSRTFTESIPNPDGKTYSKKTRREYVKPKPGSIPVLLLGNKYDLAKNNFLKELENTEPIPPLPDVIPNEIVLSPVSDDGHDDSAILAEDNQPQNADSAKIAEDNQPENNDAAKTADDTSLLQTMPPQDNPEKNENESNQIGEETEGAVITVKNDSNTENKNGDIKNNTEETVQPPVKYKKIFPKDERNGTSQNGIDDHKIVLSPSPEDAKSAVTYATSVTSLLPPCVEEIERIAEKYDFIAGVPVSAKTMNGGVQEAIQSLLRHLVAKKLFNLDAKESILERKNLHLDVASTRSGRSRTSKMSRKSRKKLGPHFEPLQEVGIIEIDEVIRYCNPTLHDAEELTTGYDEALHGFKMVCFKNKLTSGTRVSLEVCITALKQGMSSMNSDLLTSDDPRENIRLLLKAPEKEAEQESSLNLIVLEKEGFPDLRVVDSNRDDVEKLDPPPETGDNRPQIPIKILKVIHEYREKFLPKAIEVMKHGAGVQAVLGERTMQLTAKEEKAWETAVAAGLSHGEVRRILSTLAQDKARLRGTVEHVRETRKAVQTAAGKIRAALLF